MPPSSIDDIIRQLDFNFTPGQRVVLASSTPALVKARGIVISVDNDQFACRVMWTLPNGATRFQVHANVDLRHY